MAGAGDRAGSYDQFADPALRAALLAMAAEDRRVRAELAADGSLFDGYHPRMAGVHRHNAARLTAILDRLGWPGPARVGADGSAAAWLVLQHAIGDPPLMRRGLALLSRLAPGGVDPARLAMLEDRIRAFEGRPQRFGTQYDWDETGQLGPLPIEDPERADGLRRSVGLGPPEENTRRIREQTSRAGERQPPDWADRQRRKREWERYVGWHDRSDRQRPARCRRDSESPNGPPALVITCNTAARFRAFPRRLGPRG